ncbi:hypothetical protein GCM10027615_43920 [Plantactinospora veratri]
MGRGPPVVKFLRTLPVPLALVAMIGLAGAVLGGVYADSLLSRLVLGAAVGSVGVSLAARRLPSWLVAPLSVLVLLGYTAAALRFTAQRADLPGSLGEVAADAARNGIPRLLTALIPVEPMPDTVIVPLVAAWLAGLAGAEVGIRADRVLLGLTAPAALYAGALYVVGPNADSTPWLTVAFAAAGAVALAAGGRPAPPERGGGPDPAGDPGPGSGPRCGPAPWPVPRWVWCWCSASPCWWRPWWPGRSTPPRSTRAGTCNRPRWTASTRIR